MPNIEITNINFRKSDGRILDLQLVSDSKNQKKGLRERIQISAETHGWGKHISHILGDFLRRNRKIEGIDLSEGRLKVREIQSVLSQVGELTNTLGEPVLQQREFIVEKKRGLLERRYSPIGVELARILITFWVRQEESNLNLSQNEISSIYLNRLLNDNNIIILKILNTVIKENRNMESIDTIINIFNSISFEQLNSNQDNNSVMDVILERIISEMHSNRVADAIPENIISVSQVDTGEPQVRLSQIFRSNGFQVTIPVSVTELKITLHGQAVFISNSFATINFMPGDRVNSTENRAEMKDSIIKGIKGLGDYIKAVQEGKFPKVEWLSGVTNKNMALFALRLGFQLSSDSYNDDGTIKEKYFYTVFARITDVEERFTMFNEGIITNRNGKAHRQNPSRLLQSLGNAS